jgi:hypothetical protein
MLYIIPINICVLLLICPISASTCLMKMLHTLFYIQTFVDSAFGGALKLAIGWSWIRRRWYEFRMGHSTYLSFILSLTNFLLISYNFLISQIPVLKSVFSSMAYFAVIFLIAYVPFTVYIGHLHNRKQLSTDLIVSGEKNPFYVAVLEKLDEIEKELQEIGAA